MIPRLKLDIGWTDLLSALLPSRATARYLEHAIAAHAPPSTHCVIALSVRTLFDALLAETGQAPVLMSAVTIDDMATLVRSSGRALHTTDIDIATLAPDPANKHEKASGPGAAMIVIAHLFGSRSAVKGIAPAKWLVIEDCAQAFDGRLSLSEGADVALYSFGPIKPATALGGGVALFRDPDFAARVKARIASYPALPESWFLRRLVKFIGLKLLNLRPVYTCLLAALQLLGRDPDAALGGLARGFGKGQPIAEAVRQKPPLRLLALLERRLRTWKPTPDATPSLLDRLAGTLIIPGEKTGAHRWWLAPVLVADPAALVLALRERGYDATRGATSMRAIKDDAGNIRPEAQHMIEHVVYLPKPANEAEAGALAGAVETAFAALKLHPSRARADQSA